MDLAWNDFFCKTLSLEVVLQPTCTCKGPLRSYSILQDPAYRSGRIPLYSILFRILLDFFERILAFFRIPTTYMHCTIPNQDPRPEYRTREMVPEKLSGGVPHLWPKSAIFPTLFMTRLACTAGEISSSKRSHRKKFRRHLEFFMQWKTGERKVLPREWEPTCPNKMPALQAMTRSKIWTLFMTWTLHQNPVSDLHYNWIPSSDQR